MAHHVVISSGSGQQGLRGRVTSGILVGVVFATVLTVLIGIVSIIRGGRNLQANETSFLRVALVYYLGGVIGGALVGALRPMARGLIGSGILGFLTGFVIYYAAAKVGFVDARWAKDAFVIALIAGAAVGAPVGIIVSRQTRE